MRIDVTNHEHVEVDEVRFSIGTYGYILRIGLSSGAEYRFDFLDYEEALEFRAKLECIADVAPELREAIDVLRKLG